jgi:hypothetical protein
MGGGRKIRWALFTVEAVLARNVYCTIEFEVLTTMLLLLPQVTLARKKGQPDHFLSER